MDTVYVYKEWYDNYSYREEMIKIFRRFDTAKTFLTCQIKEQFGTNGDTLYEIWQNLTESGNVDPDEDTYDETLDNITIMIGNGDGDTSYYMVQRQDIIEN